MAAAILTLCDRHGFELMPLCVCLSHINTNSFQNAEREHFRYRNAPHSEHCTDTFGPIFYSP